MPALPSQFQRSARSAPSQPAAFASSRDAGKLRRSASPFPEGPFPYLVLGGAQLAVGAAAIFARYALTAASPIAVSASRLCIASLVLLAIRALRRERGERLSSSQRTTLWLAGVALAIHFASWIGSLNYTSVAISTLLVSVTPIWTAIYDAIVRGRRFPIAIPIAFIAGMLGLAMITSSSRTAPPYPGHMWLGAALALVGSVGFAAYLLLVREVRAELSTRTIVTHTYTAAAIALVLASAAVRQAPPPIHAGAAWGGILAMALISQLLGHTGMNASLRWFSPVAVAFTTLLEPVFAALLALAIFGEALTGIAVAGAALLLGGIGLAIWLDPDQ
jgi:drug/metabolite transporter (DMT)-like permease